MLKSYRNKETEYAAKGRFSKRFPPDIAKRVKMRLDRINAAVSIGDLAVPPSHHLEALKGSRRGQYSIRINKQRRICFRWAGGHAYDVELVDYH